MRLSKNLRFRLFVAMLTVAYSVAFLFVVGLQSRVSSRRLAAMEARFESRLLSLSESKPPQDASGSSTVEAGERMVFDDVPRFVVLGHGRSKRFGYLDIQYVCDGAVDRFFYRPETVVRVVDDIEREVFRHENGLITISPSGGGVRGEAREKIF